MVLITAIALLALVWGPASPLGEPALDTPGANGAELGTTTSTGAPPPEYTLAFPSDPDSLSVADASFFGWSLLDRVNNKVTGSANASTDGNTVESMIKPWIAADYLRQASEDGQELDEETLDELTLMIVDSNDPLAEDYYQLGGADDLVDRLARVCGLTDLYIEPTLWGMTWMTPLDAVRYGACLADGRAAGPKWTPWLLDVMKHVRGSVSDQDSGEVQGGRWGIIDGLPAELVRDTSIKNGWTVYEDGWHVNCLAIHPKWVLSVMMRMSDELEKAAAGCAAIASGLVVDGRH